MRRTIKNYPFELDCEPDGEVKLAVFEQNGKTVEVRRVTERCHGTVMRRYKKPRWCVAIRRTPRDKLVDRGSIIKQRTFASWERAAEVGIELVEETRHHVA